MAGITPPIGATGIYILKEPFNTKLVPNIQYTCNAVRVITEAVLGEEDLKQAVYLDNGLTEENFLSDLVNKVNIITIQNRNGDKLLVPSSCILKIPDINGVPYTPTIIGINLGPICDRINLDPLKTKLADIVSEYIGVNNVSVKEAIAGATEILSLADHDSIEATRQQNILENETDYSKYIRVKAERDAMAIKIAALENHIRVNHI